MKELWHRILKHKKWVLVSLLALATVISTVLYYQNKGKTQTSTAQQVVVVERGDISSVVEATGTIKPVNMVDISSKITAQIKEVKVRENDTVKAGQVLVVLEDTGLQAQVTQAKERLNNTAVQYERMARMNRIGGVSNAELDNASMNYNIAQATYDEVMSKLNETMITSPINGNVIGEPLSAGELVAQGVNNPTVILTVADMSQMQIEAQIDQTDIGKVTLGQRVTFAVDAYPGKEFTGKVAIVSKKPVVQQNVTYYLVTIDVDNAENLLNPGMVARVSIVASESKGALTLPLAAVRSDKTGKYVVVMDQSGKLNNVPVTTGNLGEDRIEILSGVKAGDKVVIAQSKTQSQAGSGQQAGQQGAQPRSGGSQNPLNMMRRM